MKKSIFLLLIICSCNKTQEVLPVESTDIYHEKEMNSDYYTDAQNKQKINKLVDKVIHGDIESYNQMSKIYILSENRREFLYYSLFMAEEYNYVGAYIDNFQNLKTSKNKQTNMLATYYLLRAYELGGYEDASHYLEERFPDGKIPKSGDYWDQIH